MESVHFGSFHSFPAASSSSSPHHPRKREQTFLFAAPSHSVIRLISSHRFCISRFSHKQPIQTSLNKYGLPCKRIYGARSHHWPPSLSFYNDKINRTCNGCDCQRKGNLSRDVVARSELAGTGSTEASYPSSEILANPKVRGICFYIVTALSAIILFVPMLLQHPFVLLFDRYRRKAQFLIAKAWSSLTVAPFIKIYYEGLENLPSSETPAMYVSNHQSFLDIYTLLTLGRSFKFISKTSIFLYPIIGWAMFLLGVIPLKRMDTRSQLDCLKQCIALINKGASVCFFPEGTRSKDGKLGPFKKGAFSVAAKTGVPVVPITLIGTGNIMPVGMEDKLYPGSVKVIIHQPIAGSNADALCNEARAVIEDSLIRQG